MPQYRFHLIGSDGRVAELMERECDGDLEALDDAQALSNWHEVEVWQGELRVLRVKRGNAPLDPFDTTSG